MSIYKNKGSILDKAHFHAKIEMSYTGRGSYAAGSKKSIGIYDGAYKAVELAMGLKNKDQGR